jgi:hypothetical protein
MNIKRYTVTVLALALAFFMGCRDESLYPLPYDDRSTGHFLRIYSQSSFIFSRENLDASAFEAVYESVDAEQGNTLDSVTFFASFRRGAILTREVVVKRVHFSEFGFAMVQEPTFSEYLRSAPYRVTAREIRDALQARASADPPGPLAAYPADAGLLGDLFIIRWRVRTKDGQNYSVLNQQATVDPSQGNLAEANMTPNVTRGLFYNAPYMMTMPVAQSVVPAVTNPEPYTGTYRMTQVAVWSPNHSVALHMTNMPRHLLKPFIFGNSDTDSTQTVTITTVPGGLPSERQFTCRYRGQTVTMRISLESAAQVPTGAGAAGVLATLTTGTGTDVPPGTHRARGLGFPAGTTAANLGAVNVRLANTGVACAGNAERLFYQIFPLGGSFNPIVATNPVTGAAVTPSSPMPLPWGAPRSTFPNRGLYRIDRDGTTVGDVFTIGVDDDVDEYGRRNGYCAWYRRVTLRLERI